MAVQTHDKSLDVFRIRSDDEIKKRRAKRKRQAAQAKSTKATEDTTEGEAQNTSDDNEIKAEELFAPYLTIRAKGKIRSFDFPRNPVESNKNTNVCYQQHYQRVFLKYKHRYYCLWRRMHWRCIAFLWRIRTKSSLWKPRDCFSWKCLGTVPQFALYASALMILFLSQCLMVSIQY